jgi:hypothetical protein
MGSQSVKSSGLSYITTMYFIFNVFLSFLFFWNVVFWDNLFYVLFSETLYIFSM